LNKILSNGYPAINLVMDSEAPQITTANVNNLGITDLLGKGESDFTGSPPNRIHNIETGANKLNGLLIKPGETFSAIKAIGNVDGENGFLKELVIKEDRTTPEFGGGLCQVGTTLFRAALGSGLPIAERRSHSYRVVYYEPAGTDATIYNPSPDLKFTNNTGNYILIQTKIEGNKLAFEFWGKKDGRESSYTNSVIYNITAPPPVRYIYTTELAIGEKKKVETAHKGADAYFKYTIKYPDERGSIEKTFTSHYKPWAEVWLIGATSTPQ
ncbi:MAG: VanW family protein, partial [Patescibacteria group bacterium]